ncbi:MAG: fumarylacetoacetate hydrolase family protein [Chloroflexi bacterium]|nr:fumarylacetoacetate hydrolase family protein [Chloroflexota bacterium]
MRLTFFNDWTFGAIKGDRIVDLTEPTSHFTVIKPQDRLEAGITHWDQVHGDLESHTASQEGVALAEVQLRAPVPSPGRVLCMAGNYMESGTIPGPYEIDAFLKSPSSLIGHGETVVLPDAPAEVFHHEAELGVVMSKTTSHVDAADAMDHVFGYLNLMDVSARGINPNGNNSFWWQKSWDTFGPIGPAIVTKDEVPDPQVLDVKLWDNGDLRHDFDTSDMARKVPQVIEIFSNLMRLEPGDVLATGTNHLGLGPMQDGDEVTLEIGNLGKLTVNVKDTVSPARSWVRETVAEALAREGK